MLFFEPVYSLPISFVPPLLYTPASVSPVASEFRSPERSHAEKKENKVLTRSENPFGVSDNQSHFDFPVVGFPKFPKGGGTLGTGGPEGSPLFLNGPVRSVPERIRLYPNSKSLLNSRP